MNSKAPALPFHPRDPRSYRPAIALVGCGGVSEHHLRAYRAAGYRISALCDLDEGRARQRAEEFFPAAAIYTDYHEVLAREEIEVVDLAAHPEQREPMIAAALHAGKHVLSQKPFVTDLERGQRLVELAEERGCKLAVNLNGRWAPHHRFMTLALREGLIGAPFSVHFSVHFDHNWIRDTPFDAVHDVILWDFAIHWFDLLNLFMGGAPARRVHATLARSPAQRASPPLLGQALVEYESGQASLVFDGDTRHGEEDRSILIGPRGTLRSVGPNLEEQEVELWTAEGRAAAELEGSWFTSGFHGTMAELLCAIEENREPENSARASLDGLALCFAAVASAALSEPVEPGAVRRLVS